MNKQELIKHFEEMEYVSVSLMGKKAFIDLIEQLDEPQKPVVPQFVADWIEHTKKENYHIFGAIQATESDDKLDDWIWSDDNMEVFARAWLDGYTVEKEKRYLVKIKGIDTNFSFLNRHRNENYWIFSSKDKNTLYQTHHTRKELEDADFGEVFNSPLFEVEEVEE